VALNGPNPRPIESKNIETGLGYPCYSVWNSPNFIKQMGLCEVEVCCTDKNMAKIASLTKRDCSTWYSIYTGLTRTPLSNGNLAATWVKYT